MSDSNCILYIEHGEIIGGSNVSLKEVIIDALQNGYRCHVICVNKLLADVFTEIGATTYVCTLAPLYHNTAYYYKFTVLDFLRFAKVLAKKAK